MPHIRSIKRSSFGTTIDGGIKSQDIETTLKGINKSKINLCASLFDGRNAWFAFANEANTTNNIVLVLDTVTNGWVRFTGIKASCFDAFVLGSTAQIFFGEAGATSKAYVVDSSTTDDGTAISFSITTRRYGGTMPELIKKWRYFTLNVKETGDYDLTVDFAVDGFTFGFLKTINLGGSGSVFDNIILDTSRLGGTDVKRQRESFTALNTYYLQLKMYESATSSSVTLRDWEIMYFPRKVRH